MSVGRNTLSVAVASLGLVSPGAVIARPPKQISDLFKITNFAIFSLLHKEIEISYDMFLAFYTKHVIYHTKF